MRGTIAIAARDRRALVLGSLVLAAALVTTFGVLPAARAVAAARHQLADERDLLARERAIVQRPAPAAELRHSAIALAAVARDAFDVTEPELAAVELARTAGMVASLSGIGALRAEPHGVEAAADGWTRVRARVSGESDFAQLMLLLYRLEREPWQLRIDQLMVRGAAGTTGGLLAFTLVVRAIGATDRTSLIARAPVPPTGTTATVSGAAASGPMASADRPPSGTELLAMLPDDPFQPGVNPPGFALPAEPVHGVQGDTQAALVLIGTVALPGERGVVMAQWGSEAPRLIRLGERIGGMRLRRVEPGAAEFEDESGGSLRLRVPKPGA